MSNPLKQFIYLLWGMVIVPHVLCQCGNTCTYNIAYKYNTFLTRFSTKMLVIRLVNGGRSGMRILNGVKLRFLLNNFSLLWPIDTKLAVYVAYIKRQLGIATQVSVIKVKVTVTKNRNSVSTQ